MRYSYLLSFVLAGCLTGTYTPPPGQTGGGDDGGAPSGSADLAGAPSANPDLAGVQGTGVSGTISTDATWSTLIMIGGDTTIAPGATVTVTAGTTISVASGANLIVGGKLLVQGTSAMPVKFVPETAMGSWGGLSVKSGGSLDVAYATVDYAVTPLSTLAGATLVKLDHTNLTHYTGVGAQIGSAATFTYVRVEFGGSDGITVNAGAADTVTITDSIFHATGGDATVVNAGNLTFNHNAVYGDTAGGGLGLHCACHYSSTGTFLVDHNDFYDAVYGFMASDMGATSKVNSNNFYQNGNGWGTSDGNPVNAGVDLTNNYWGGGAPPLIQGNSRTTPYSTTKIAGTGPR